jgi:hypothetical protein
LKWGERVAEPPRGIPEVLHLCSMPMRIVLLVGCLAVARLAWAQAQPPRAAASGKAQRAPAKAARRAAPKPAPAAPAANAAASDKPAPRKVVSLDAAAVTGERQKPRAAYVLPPNVKAVRDAANSITDEHIESARRR